MIQIKEKTNRKIVSVVAHLITDYRLLIIAGFPAALLSGCMGIYEGGFECPAGTGVGCKSISEVNHMINQGTLPKAQVEQLEPSKLEIWYAPSSVQYSVPSVQHTLLEAKVILPRTGA